MQALLIVALLGSFHAAHGIAEGIMDLDILGGLLSGVQEMFTDMNTTEVELEPLLGKWHQMYKAAINFDVFRTNMYCHVAYFKPNLIMGPEGFSIEEAYHVISKSGPIETYLKDVAKYGPGQYWVYPHQYFYPHQFFVIKPGAMVNGSYQYLIATDQNKLALVVLARDPQEFYQLYDREVLDFLTEEKFGHPVFWNQPVGIYQGPDCYYPTEKEVFARRVFILELDHAEQQGSIRALPFVIAARQRKAQQAQAQASGDPLQAIQGLVGQFTGRK